MENGEIKNIDKKAEDWKKEVESKTHVWSFHKQEILQN